MDGTLTTRPNAEGGVDEIMPPLCREGHRLRAGRVLVGWDGANRTYWCRDCEDAGAPNPMHRYRA